MDAESNPRTYSNGNSNTRSFGEDRRIIRRVSLFVFDFTTIMEGKLQRLCSIFLLLLLIKHEISVSTQGVIKFQRKSHQHIISERS